ncbi:unnamed protein product [Polarella glacialis]|uniref:peptide-methionine (R)-S-oxide reductase n=2 Tax=Polarella glacialis TaxID=89957 RepID=A0A813E8U6_POLGL|nr:unnamed protein product [Polarella glacialis]|mmetsp:Transcript_54519/g.98303  ORF Transcript_54519/g.98303 Transcript_54519/m.98303 type:complete len:107 (-) Transcript_54519:9-329(-)
MSAAAGPGGNCEGYLEHWETGVYNCGRCSRALYSSAEKWRGPCAWPSFRCPTGAGAISERPVQGYSRYQCAVLEVYCGNCRLFIGHSFEDAREKGDSGAECTGWRH